MELEETLNTTIMSHLGRPLRVRRLLPVARRGLCLKGILLRDLSLRDLSLRDLSLRDLSLRDLSLRDLLRRRSNLAGQH
jgi:hypothetical protein